MSQHISDGRFQEIRHPGIHRRRITITILPILLLACFVLVAHAPAGESVYFERGNFTLTLPTGWESKDVPAHNYNYTLSAVLMKASYPDGQIIREHIGVTTEYTYFSSPESFFDRVYRDTVAVPGITPLDQGTAPIAGSTAHWFTYRWERPDGIVMAKITVLHSTLSSHRFLLMAPEDTFTACLDDFDQIVASFRPGDITLIEETE